MNGKERLFLAIGGADEALLRRSERRPRSRAWAGWSAGLAAALALAVLVWALVPKSPTVPPDDEEPPAQSPALPSNEPPLYQQIPSADTGAFHLLQFVEVEDWGISPQVSPQFSMYFNEELFTLCQEGGLYVVRARETAELPVQCRLEISHLDATTVSEAVEAVQPRLESLYESVERQEDGTAVYIPKCSAMLLRASNGTDWNDEQREVWFVDDGQGGVFVFNSIYFLEAEEGFGVAFKDMAGTFQVVGLLEPWVADLEDTAERLFEAVFANDLTSVAGDLAPGAEIYGYDEDVLPFTTVAGVDYTVDSEGEPEGGLTAAVSVKHRPVGGEDGFAYLTMKLSYTGRWRAEWIGLEK